MSTKFGEEETLRKKVWKIINLIQANQLFVHHKELNIKFLGENSKKIQSKILPEILSLCILNAIVPNSAMLLIGGHGGGKTTLVNWIKEGRFTRPKPTIGVNFEEMKIGNINFSVFDISGQKSFRSTIWKSYVMTSVGIIFVLDCSNKEQFVVSAGGCGPVGWIIFLLILIIGASSLVNYLNKKRKLEGQKQ